MLVWQKGNLFMDLNPAAATCIDSEQIITLNVSMCSLFSTKIKIWRM